MKNLKKICFLFIIALMILFIFSCKNTIYNDIAMPGQYEVFEEREELSEDVIDVSKATGDFEILESESESEELIINIDQKILDGYNSENFENKIIILPPTDDYPEGFAVRLIKQNPDSRGLDGVVSWIGETAELCIWDILDEFGDKEIEIDDIEIPIELINVNGIWLNLAIAEDVSELSQDVYLYLRELYPDLSVDSGGGISLGPIGISYPFPSGAELPHTSLGFSVGGKSVFLLQGIFRLDNSFVSLDISSSQKQIIFNLEGEQSLDLDIISAVDLSGNVVLKLPAIPIPLDPAAGAALSLKISPVIKLSAALKLDASFHVEESLDINFGTCYQDGAFYELDDNQAIFNTDFDCTDIEVAAKGAIGVGCEAYLCAVQIVGPIITMVPKAEIEYETRELVYSNTKEDYIGLNLGGEMSVGLKLGKAQLSLPIPMPDPWQIFPAEGEPSNFTLNSIEDGILISWDKENWLTDKYKVS